MLIQPIDLFVHAWLVIAVLSAAYVAWDQFTGNPEAAVMKWGFVLVTLYMGPVGLLLYVMADKEPRPGSHEEFVKALWKQGVVFQSLFMRKAMGGSYAENVRRSFLPELISMNCMMAGMAPVMVLLMMGRDMRAMWPGEPLFWMVMSLGVTAGFAIAYPVNVWMVARRMKHGLMTERAEDMKGMDHTSMKAAKPSSASAKAAHGGKKMDKKDQGASEHEGHQMPAGDMGGGHAMQPDVTRPQLVAVTGFTLLMLIAGMTLPAAFVNVRLTAHEVRGAIMPPGMIMDNNTPAEAMLDMAAVDPRDVTARYGLDTRGARPLEPRVEDGVKVFDLETSVIRWQILPTVSASAYAFNGQVPGPTLRFRQGDRVRINVTNRLPESTTVHWHGLILPNVMDGPAHVTQAPIEHGQLYRYEFTAVQYGSYLYHSHDHLDRQQALGLYGALIIDPASPAEEIPADHEYTIELQEWLIREGLTYPAMPMDGGQPNYFTINGRAYPSTDTIHMKMGETVKVRFIGSNNGFIHPMHIHGGPFVVVARDGETLAPAARFKADTINVGPGQRYDVIWTAVKPGKWMIHCHIPHHTTNNNTEQEGGGGLMMHIEVAGDPRT